MNIKKDILFTVFFLLIITDLFLVSDISRYLNVHDLAFISGVIFVIINYYGKNKIHINSVSKLYVFYILICVFVSLIGLLLKTSDFRFIPYIIKEVEYFFVYYIIVVVKKGEIEKYYKLLIIVLTIGLIFGLIQVITGTIAHYGIGSMVSLAPSVSGNYYYSIFILLTFFNVDKKNKFVKLLIYLSFVLTLLTISRTYIVTLLVATFLMLSYRVKKYFLSVINKSKFNIKSLLITILLIICLIGSFGLFSERYGNELMEVKERYLDNIIERMLNIDSAVNVRANISSDYVENMLYKRPYGFIFGLGKSSPEVYLGTTTLGVDNQYIRLLLETGLFGILIWMLILRQLVIASKSIESEKRYILMIYLLTYILMGFTTEVLQTMKQAIMFWFIISIVLSTNTRVKKEQ